MTNPNNSERQVSDSETLDEIAEDLQRLRVEKGFSYQEIVSRITKAREAKGMAPAAARIARTTVYDCFRTGRTRINPELVGEIVCVLTGDDEQAAEWVQRCKTAQTNGGKSSAKEHERQELAGSLPDPKPMSFWSKAMVMVACVALNILLCFLIATVFPTGFPLFMDMIGIAVVSMIFGARWGMAAAVVAQLLPMLYAPVDKWPFVFVGCAGALVWGLGVHKFGMAKTFLRYLLLNLLAGFVCTTVAVPVIMVVFGGDVRMQPVQYIVDNLILIGDNWVAAVFSANLLTSLVDKLLAGLIALILAGTVFKRYAPTDLVALTMTPGQRSQVLNRQIPLH